MDKDTPEYMIITNNYSDQEFINIVNYLNEMDKSFDTKLTDVDTKPSIYVLHNNKFIARTLSKLKEYVMEKDLNQSVIIPKVSKKSSILPDKLEKYTDDGVSTLTMYLGSFMYLASRHKDQCITVKREVIPKYWDDYGTLGITYTISTDEITVSPYLINRIKFDCLRNSKKRFIAIFIYILCTNGGYHANMLIYDKNNKSMERFEPHGDITICNSDMMDKNIIDALKQKIPEMEILYYYKPLDFCPEKSFQTLQGEEQELKVGDPGGFCMIWSLWYTDLRLSNPDISRNAVVRIALDKLLKGEVSLTTFIRNYAIAIQQYYREIQQEYAKQGKYINYNQIYQKFRDMFEYE